MIKNIIGAGLGVGGALIGGGATFSTAYLFIIKPMKQALDSYLPHYKTYAVPKNKKLNYLALGDSVISGYSTYRHFDATSYTDFVADSLKESGHLKSYKNFGVSGFTTNDLIMQLSNHEVRMSITKADMINISIGANDFLEIVKIFQKHIDKQGKENYTTIDFQDFLSAMSGSGNSGTKAVDDKDRNPDIYKQRGFTDKVLDKGIEHKVKTFKSPIEALFELVNNVFSNSDKSYSEQIFGFEYGYLKDKMTQIIQNIFRIEKIIQDIQENNKDEDGKHHKARIRILGYEFPFTSFLNKFDKSAKKGFHPIIDGKKYDLPTPLYL
jgi:hypothetical protein